MKTDTILISGAAVLPLGGVEEVREGVDLLIEEGRVAAMGPASFPHALPIGSWGVGGQVFHARNVAGRRRAAELEPHLPAMDDQAWRVDLGIPGFEADRAPGRFTGDDALLPTA